MTGTAPDWTRGVPRVLVTTCLRCGRAWYLPHEHCPVCGATRHRTARPAGSGTCVAVTRVHATAVAGADPVDLALVELDEEVLVLGRADGPLRPGDRVRLAVREDPTGTALVPVVTPVLVVPVVTAVTPEVPA